MQTRQPRARRARVAVLLGLETGCRTGFRVDQIYKVAPSYPVPFYDVPYGKSDTVIQGRPLVVKKTSEEMRNCILSRQVSAFPGNCHRSIHVLHT